MPSGGCFCDKVRVSFTGEPNALVLCHCTDCKKISGSAFSNNIVVPEGNFKLESGTPKQISKTADSGKNITSSFCPDCGTTLFRTGDTFAGAVIIKSGILDDYKWCDEHPPTGELFAPERANWCKALDGAAQKTNMS